MLTPEEIAQFHDCGYVIARNAVSADVLDALRAELDGWIEESREHAANYGETPDGKKRFDLEAGHSAAAPKLRRVANPADVSEAYRNVLFDGPIPDMVAQLIGPDVKFHHSKLNIKLPGMATKVDWHQDHPYDPHSNDDVLTTLLMLDAMTEENGALKVVPGSHRERYSHYQDDRFIGTTAPEHDADFARRAEAVTGEPGDVCFMHTWCVHGSGNNRAATPRRLLICDYVAADAVPLTPTMVPSVHTGRIVRGRPSRTARLRAGSVELPQRYEENSFFDVQQKKKAGMR